MKRIPEPELMLDREHCEQYYKFPRDAILSIVMNLMTQSMPKDATGKVADLGTGPGQLPKLIHDAFPNLTIDAYDGSMSMLDIAYHHIGETNRIELVHNDLRLANKKYDYIISVFTLHQLHDPNDFWKTVERISNPDSKVIIVDLLRPDDDVSVNKILNYIKTKDIVIPPRFEEDFRNSLYAAFTLDEIKQQVNDNTSQTMSYTVLKNPHSQDDFSLVVAKNFAV